MTPTLPKSILDDAHALYALPLPIFSEKIAEFTLDDKRLELLFFATRQCYLDALLSKTSA